MAEFLVQAPAKGINTLLPDNMISPQEAAVGTKNIIYDRGLLKTPFGYAKMDLSSGLDSGNPVLSVFLWRELDRTSHVMAVTTRKIYDHDRNNSEWDDVTGTLLSGNLNDPVSHVELGHTDAIYINDDSTKSQWYHHLIVSDGGQTDIKRWAGKYETNFLPLTGGGGYHDGTTHRAQHVGTFRSRLMALSPKTYSSSSKTWAEHNQQIRWPQVGKAQTWTGTGSGFFELIETGGQNLWAANLGGQYIIYQTRGIWSVNWVGGPDVFDPRPEVPDLGLLEAHLVTAENNVHYFVGSDYNVYAYYGGTSIRSIGDKITEALRDDLSTDYQNRSWIQMDENGERLWIFIVTGSNQYITKAYGVDLKTEAWMIRDFSDLYTSTSGITAVGLVPSDTFMTGETYDEVLSKLSAQVYDSTDNPPERYGDVLTDISITLSTGNEISAGNATWEAGGLYLSSPCTDITWAADLTPGYILRVPDGSTQTNCPDGFHYYTCYSVGVDGTTRTMRFRPRYDGTGRGGAAGHFNYRDVDGTTNAPYKLDFVAGATEITIGSTLIGSANSVCARVSQVVRQEGEWTAGDATGYLVITNPNGDFTNNDPLYVDNSSGTSVADVSGGDFTLLGRVGIADVSGNVPALDATYTFFNPDGDTYRQITNEVNTKARMVLGDSCGFVYQFDNAETLYDGTKGYSFHYTPTIDWQLPEILKRWGEVIVTAKYDSDMTSTGWIQVEQTLDGSTWYVVGSTDVSSKWKDYHFYLNNSSERTQFRISNKPANLFVDPDITKWDSSPRPWRNITTGSNVSWWQQALNVDGDYYAQLRDYTANEAKYISMDHLKIVAGRTYTLNYGYKARSYGRFRLSPFVGGTAGTTKISGGQGADQTSNEGDTYTATVGQDVLWDVSYISSTGALGSGFLLITDVSLLEVPTGHNFMVREMKMKDVEVLDNR